MPLLCPEYFSELSSRMLCRGGRWSSCRANMYVKTADLAQRQLLNVLSFIIYSPSYNSELQWCSNFAA